MQQQNPPHTAAVIVAAGRGNRMGADTNGPKQYRSLGPSSVLQETVSRFVQHTEIHLVQVVIHPEDHDLYAESVNNHPKLMIPTEGGATRQESCRLGLEALSSNGLKRVLIHDAARPFVSPATITDTLGSIRSGCCVVPAIPIADTIKRAEPSDGESLAVTETVSRENLFLAQTPQGFCFEEILAAHRQMESTGETNLTDDAAVAERVGMKVLLSAGNADNFKITTALDLERAYQMMAPETPTALPDIRTGIGYDIHRLVKGDGVVLCGIEIPGPWRLEGHSDADVGLHAITDALLGTIGKADIGSHFPPSDPQWRDADSDRFLAHATDFVLAEDGIILNLDISIICEEPKIGPHREDMRRRIAEICKIEMNRVSVKATTNETIGAVGRREGIAAMATATVGFLP